MLHLLIVTYYISFCTEDPVKKCFWCKPLYWQRSGMAHCIVMCRVYVTRKTKICNLYCHVIIQPTYIQNTCNVATVSKNYWHVLSCLTNRLLSLILLHLKFLLATYKAIISIFLISHSHILQNKRRAGGDYWLFTMPICQGKVWYNSLFKCILLTVAVKITPLQKINCQWTLNNQFMRLFKIDVGGDGKQLIY